MALKLYRQHGTDCEGKHPEDSRSGEFEEGRRGWKKCACVVHVSGTLGGSRDSLAGGGLLGRAPGAGAARP